MKHVQATCKACSCTVLKLQRGLDTTFLKVLISWLQVPLLAAALARINLLLEILLGRNNLINRVNNKSIFIPPLPHYPY